MKRFREPHLNEHDNLDIVVAKIRAEYGETIDENISGDLRKIIKSDPSGWADTLTIRALVYRSGNIYHVVAINHSLMTGCIMFRAALDDAEQAIYEKLKSEYRYNDAIEYLSENTF